MSRSGVRVTLAALSCGALIVAALIRTYAKPGPQILFSGDQQAYLSLARQPFVQTRVVYPPATWRVLPPLVARGIGEVTGGGPERGFLVLTFACYALIPVAAFAWLRALGVAVDAALSGAAVVSITPTVLGYTAWDVVRVDPPSCLMLFLGALAVVKRRKAMFILVVTALAFTKETAMIVALFGAAWATLVDRRMLATSVVAVAVALFVRRILLQAWLMPVAVPFDNLFGFKQMIRDELTLRYVARRLLLASASTWNVMLPLAAAWLVDQRRHPRAQAFLCAILVAEAQILFASDTQRLVAAAYPFVIACCAFQMERYDRRSRMLTAAALVAAQVPWLLENGQVVHFVWLRGVEIAIALVTAGLAVWRLRYPAAQPHLAPA